MQRPLRQQPPSGLASTLPAHRVSCSSDSDSGIDDRALECGLELELDLPLQSKRRAAGNPRLLRSYDLGTTGLDLTLLGQQQQDGAGNAAARQPKPSLVQGSFVRWRRQQQQHEEEPDLLAKVLQQPPQGRASSKAATVPAQQSMGRAVNSPTGRQGAGVRAGVRSWSPFQGRWAVRPASSTSSTSIGSYDDGDSEEEEQVEEERAPSLGLPASHPLAAADDDGSSSPRRRKRRMSEAELQALWAPALPVPLPSSALRHAPARRGGVGVGGSSRRSAAAGGSMRGIISSSFRRGAAPATPAASSVRSGASAPRTSTSSSYMTAPGSAKSSSGTLHTVSSDNTAAGSSVAPGSLESWPLSCSPSLASSLLSPQGSAVSLPGAPAGARKRHKQGSLALRAASNRAAGFTRHALAAQQQQLEAAFAELRAAAASRLVHLRRQQQHHTARAAAATSSGISAAVLSVRGVITRLQKRAAAMQSNQPPPQQQLSPRRRHSRTRLLLAGLPSFSRAQPSSPGPQQLPQQLSPRRRHSRTRLLLAGLPSFSRAQPSSPGLQQLPQQLSPRRRHSRTRLLLAGLPSLRVASFLRQLARPAQQQDSGIASANRSTPTAAVAASPWDTNSSADRYSIAGIFARSLNKAAVGAAPASAATALQPLAAAAGISSSRSCNSSPRPATVMPASSSTCLQAADSECEAVRAPSAPAAAGVSAATASVTAAAALCVPQLASFIEQAEAVARGSCETWMHQAGRLAPQLASCCGAPQTASCGGGNADVSASKRGLTAVPAHAPCGGSCAIVSSSSSPARVSIVAPAVVDQVCARCLRQAHACVCSALSWTALSCKTTPGEQRAASGQAGSPSSAPSVPAAGTSTAKDSSSPAGLPSLGISQAGAAARSGRQRPQPAGATTASDILAAAAAARLQPLNTAAVVAVAAAAMLAAVTAAGSPCGTADARPSSPATAVPGSPCSSPRRRIVKAVRKDPQPQRQQRQQQHQAAAATAAADRLMASPIRAPHTADTAVPAPARSVSSSPLPSPAAVGSHALPTPRSHALPATPRSPASSTVHSFDISSSIRLRSRRSRSTSPTKQLLTGAAAAAVAAGGSAGSSSDGQAWGRPQAGGGSRFSRFVETITSSSRRQSGNQEQEGAQAAYGQASGSAASAPATSRNSASSSSMDNGILITAEVDGDTRKYLLDESGMWELPTSTDTTSLVGVGSVYGSAAAAAATAAIAAALGLGGSANPGRIRLLSLAQLHVGQYACNEQ